MSYPRQAPRRIGISADDRYLLTYRAVDLSISGREMCGHTTSRRNDVNRVASCWLIGNMALAISFGAHVCGAAVLRFVFGVSAHDGVLVIRYSRRRGSPGHAMAADCTILTMGISKSSLSCRPIEIERPWAACAGGEVGNENNIHRLIAVLTSGATWR